MKSAIILSSLGVVLICLLVLPSCKRKGSAFWNSEDGSKTIAIMDSHIAIGTPWLKYYKIIHKNNGTYLVENLLCPGHDTSVIRTSINEDGMTVKIEKGEIQFDSTLILSEDIHENNRNIDFSWHKYNMDTCKMVGSWSFFQSHEVLIIDSIFKQRAAVGYKGQSTAGIPIYRLIIRDNNIFLAQNCRFFMHFQVYLVNDSVMQLKQLHGSKDDLSIFTFRRLKTSVNLDSTFYGHLGVN